MKAKRGETILALLLVLLVSITGGCASSAKNGDEETVEIVAVERGSLLTSITAVGSIRPGAEVVLSFEVSGRVTEVLIQAGDQVRQEERVA